MSTTATLDGVSDHDPADPYRGCPPAEIVDSGTDRMAALAMAKARKRLERAALTEILAPGVTIRPDSPPGVGWVLARKGHPPRYLRDRATAVEHWRMLVALEAASPTD